jgi:hypothetical protein
MTKAHWFDTLNKHITRDASRRRLLRAPGLLLAALAFSNGAVGEAKKRKKKKGHKGKGGGKGNGGGGGNSASDVCDTTWPGQDETARENRQWCKFIREQCPAGSGREFCITEGNPQDPAKVADCCNPGQVCCSGVCVYKNSAEHCGGCNRPCPDPLHICLEGECFCAGLTRTTSCNGVCVDTHSDKHNCGGCGKGCPHDQTCVDGACACPSGKAMCNGASKPCSNLASDDKHCGVCNEACMAGTTCKDRECKHQCGGDHPVPCQINTTLGPAIYCIRDLDECCAGGFSCLKGMCCASGCAYLDGSCPS